MQASRQRCAGLRAGAGQRCACQSACCVCHPHHLHDAVQAAQQAFGRALDAKCNGDDGKVAGQAKAAVRMTPTIKQLLMDHLKETLPPWVQIHHDPNKQARAFRVLVCGHGARCPVPIVDVCVCVRCVRRTKFLWPGYLHWSICPLSSGFLGTRMSHVPGPPLRGQPSWYVQRRLGWCPVLVPHHAPLKVPVIRVCLCACVPASIVDKKMEQIPFETA